MRTDITTLTVSAVSAATALWQTSPSRARRLRWCAATATAASSPPSVCPATRQSCQVTTIKTLYSSNSKLTNLLRDTSLSNYSNSRKSSQPVCAGIKGLITFLLSGVWQLKMWQDDCFLALLKISPSRGFFSSGRCDDISTAVVSDDWKLPGACG